MTLLHTLIHPSLASIEGAAEKREASRAIVLDGRDILLLYTRRYDDYTFPGGGLAPGEDPVAGLLRELAEETGAREIEVLRYFGYVDEWRPHRGQDCALLFMRSHFHVCAVARELGEAAMEHYEISNGMEPRWVDIDAAIAHNAALLANKAPGMGLSIYRETAMLRTVAATCLQGKGLPQS